MSGLFIQPTQPTHRLSYFAFIDGLLFVSKFMRAIFSLFLFGCTSTEYTY
jgi:hypothetical protein